MSGSGGVAVEQEVAEVVQAAPEKTKFNVNVVSVDTTKKLNIIKEVKSMLGLGLKEAKEMVEKGSFQFK